MRAPRHASQEILAVLISKDRAAFCFGTGEASFNDFPQLLRDNSKVRGVHRIQSLSSRRRRFRAAPDNLLELTIDDFAAIQGTIQDPPDGCRCPIPWDSDVEWGLFPRTTAWQCV
jgi:hypothetical protein